MTLLARVTKHTLTLLTALMLAPLATLHAADAQSKKPNVILMTGDDHGREEPYSGLPADLALYDDLPAKYPVKKVKRTSNETGSQVTRPQGEVLRERYAEITAMDRAIGTLRKMSSLVIP